MKVRKFKLFVSPDIKQKANYKVLKKSFEYMRDKIDTSRIEEYLNFQQKIWFEFL